MSSSKNFLLFTGSSTPWSAPLTDDQAHRLVQQPPRLPPLPDLDIAHGGNLRATSRLLFQGQTLQVLVGPTSVTFEPPIAIMQYFCSKLEERITFDQDVRRYVLHLPDEDVNAWSHLFQYMCTGDLDKSLGSRIPKSSNLSSLALLLCKMWLTTVFLGIKTVESKISDSIQRVFKVAREQGFATALAPGTIIFVWYSLQDGQYSQDSHLWNVLMTEVKTAFTSTRIRPSFNHFKKCFEIRAFKSEIGGAMAECILATLEESETTDSHTTGLAQPAEGLRSLPNPQDVLG